MSAMFGSPNCCLSHAMTQIESAVKCIVFIKIEPVREKTNNLPMRKQRRRSASR